MQFNRIPNHHFIKIFPRLKQKRITNPLLISKLNVQRPQIQNLLLIWWCPRSQKMRWLHRQTKDFTIVDWSQEHLSLICSPPLSKTRNQSILWLMTWQDSYNWLLHPFHNPCLQTLRPWVSIQLRRVRFKTNVSRLWTRSKPMKSGSTFFKGLILSNQTISSMPKQRFKSQTWRRLSKVLKSNWNKSNQKGTFVSNWSSVLPKPFSSQSQIEKAS
jgi:hypothetical protein